MTPERWGTAVEGLLRPEAAPAYRAALEWLLPRCRTEEERALAPALLLLLAPLNALVAPCRPAAGSRVNFQVTLSRQTEAGPERARLTVRTAVREDDLPTDELRLDEQKVLARPLACAACVLAELLERGGGSP